jgi:hypothetical protein
MVGKSGHDDDSFMVFTSFGRPVEVPELSGQ